MLIEVDKKTFRYYFPNDVHPFISEGFIELNRTKVEEVIRLVVDSDNVSMGLVVGVKNGILLSPFSAPFGGFHFRNDAVYISEIDRFAESLKEYIELKGFLGIDITLPPDLYNLSLNAKTVNSLLRNGFHIKTPDITNWTEPQKFNGGYTKKNCREYYRQASRNGLRFALSNDEDDKRLIYEIVYRNRVERGRPIYMTLQNIIDTSILWPVDFFKIYDNDSVIVASAIFYRISPKVAYAVFWGDSDKGRSLRAMDYLVLNLINHYKSQIYEYIDLGISTEEGLPNEGLLRFKETHECVSSLRYSFRWERT